MMHTLEPGDRFVTRTATGRMTWRVAPDGVVQADPTPPGPYDRPIEEPFGMRPRPGPKPGPKPGPERDPAPDPDPTWTAVTGFLAQVATLLDGVKDAVTVAFYTHEGDGPS